MLFANEMESKENEKGKATLFRFVHFKEENGNEKEIRILKNGKEVRGSEECGNSLITCKTPFRKGTINSWKVKLVKGALCPYLGIVGRYNSDAFCFANNPKCVLSYFYGAFGNIRWCKGGKHNETLENTRDPWKVGEILEIRVDLIEWEITFSKEGYELGRPVRIKERDAYFPAVQMRGDDILEIID